ncbi:MAG: OprO/OprP family phosphate-selective porin [Clostridium sp.]|nr:OprO/OprP family phosphate-selective porin [Prevotella sp.]MCM1429339.1 OprO/OprP family phosphate-selective porin [Clostridium sp.]MCM1475627.1 OprO/OprP family phosphate-selective porin [Muribaculaceae bacterium]
MKKTLIISAAALVGIPVGYAQSSSPSINRGEEKGLIETLANIEKKTDKFNLYLNMHGDYEMNWEGSDFQEGKFQMKQLRIEAKGDINDWLSYRYRQRLNKGDNPNGYRDNLLNSIDIAGIGLKFNKWQLFLGKQCAAYGGIEFDLNPIEIYQYSDMVNNMSNFMSGIDVGYNFTPAQQLRFQILNAYNGTSYDMYGDYTKAKLPMVYTLNWNGNFNDFYKTRWSASIMNETKDAHMYYFALGNEFNFTDKFGAYFDWLYSLEGVDRKGIITNIVGGETRDGVKYNATKASYMSFILHLNYRFLPNWNVFLKGMYETAGISKTHINKATNEKVAKGNYSTTYSYIGGVEYYPFKDRNLHFFATYVGQSHVFSSKAKILGQDNYNTSRFSLGFIWQMPVF